MWDIPSEKCLNTFGNHTDYVRAGCVSPIAPNIVLSGGYDGIIKMYDTRTDKTTFEVKHGSPIESLLFLPTGGIFISAGGTEIKVWDALMNGKLFANISQHTKTVTSLKLASNGRRLMSGSLDRHIKIYDVSSYQVVHNVDFPNAVLSVGISPNDTTLVAGMVDGLVSISRRQEENITEETKTRKIKQAYTENRFDQVIYESKHQAQQRFDKYLRKYEYSKALSEVMRDFFLNKSPHITCALINELHRRKGLERALIGRDQKFIYKFVRYLTRYIGDARYTSVLLDATEVLLDVYEDKIGDFSPELSKAFIDLASRMEEEENLSLECLNVQGAYELILAGASIQSSDIAAERNTEILIPSENANEHSIINV